MSSIVIASRNQGKLAEFQQLFQHLEQTIVPISQFSDQDVEETGLSFVENALLKARFACQISGNAAIADDSGLVVNALGGKPGIYSARYAGEHGNAKANNHKLLEALQTVDNASRDAYFVCCLVYLRSVDDPCPIVCQAKWHGSILPSPQGEQGFGYDPVFYVAEYDCSAAQLTPEIKNRISHRGQALADLQSLLSK